MSKSEMDGVRSFAASISFVEDLLQPVEGNMQDTPESVRNSVMNQGLEWSLIHFNKSLNFLSIMLIRKDLQQ